MKRLRQIIALMVFLLSLKIACGQCNGSLYGISAGFTNEIFSVNTTTGALTAMSGSITSSTSAHPNGLAYAGGTTPTFYFFANSQPGTLAFESFVPGAVAPAGAFNTLAAPSNAALGVTVGTINSGAIAPNYQGYYCMDTNGYLYYYSISGNSWTLITKVFKDQSGTDITATMATYSSGDIAFDGNGNLWLLLANQSTSKFGLYEVYASVPTTAVSSITARQVVALGQSMPDGYDPIGIAFNPAGQMYISTVNTSGSPQQPGHLFLWNTPSSTPQEIPNSITPATMGVTVTISAGYDILDLASCSLPLTILPVAFEQVTAFVNTSNNIPVSWQVAQEVNVRAYSVERSSDGTNWQSIGSLIAKGNNLTASYTFLDDHPLYGNSYYRVVETDWNGGTHTSSLVSVQLKASASVRLWPNPATGTVYVENPYSAPLTVSIFDGSGRELLRKVLQPGVNQMSISTLSTGLFVLKPISTQTALPLPFVKIKQ